MVDNKIYNRNDLDDFADEYAKIIAARINELNTDVIIIYPTLLEYKEMAKSILEKLTDTSNREKQKQTLSSFSTSWIKILSQT